MIVYCGKCGHEMFRINWQVLSKKNAKELRRYKWQSLQSLILEEFKCNGCGNSVVVII